MTRPILLSSLLAIFAIACGESASSGPTRVVAPKPAAAPAEPPPDDAGRPSQPECTADTDCATTVLQDAPVTSEADCCFPTCAKRVAPRARVDELQAAFGATCKAVQCAPQSCPTAPDPVPVCRDRRCTAAP